jgi:hypothetical protein
LKRARGRQRGRRRRAGRGGPASDDTVLTGRSTGTRRRREGGPRRSPRRAHERLGIGHAEIGAHLLALWELPHAVVEAVAFHHRPLVAGNPAPAVAAVHAATALANDPETDVPDLGRFGERLVAARAVARAARRP